MAIVLKILSLIGLILLAVLCILLAIILIVLLVPVRYTAAISKHGGTLQADGRVTWLLRAVHIPFRIRADGLEAVCADEQTEKTDPDRSGPEKRKIRTSLFWEFRICGKTLRGSAGDEETDISPDTQELFAEAGNDTGRADEPAFTDSEAEGVSAGTGKKAAEGPAGADTKAVKKPEGTDTKTAEGPAGTGTKAAEEPAGTGTKAAEEPAGTGTKAAEGSAGADTKSAEGPAGADTKAAEEPSGTHIKTGEEGNAAADKKLTDSSGRISALNTTSGTSNNMRGASHPAVYDEKEAARRRKEGAKRKPSVQPGEKRSTDSGSAIPITIVPAKRPGKLEMLLARYGALIGKIKKAVARGQSVLEVILAWLDYVDSRPFDHAMSVIIREVKAVLKHLLPGKISGEIAYGTGDPAMTGQILAGVAAFYPVLPPRLAIIPDFEETKLEADVQADGRIFMIVLLWRALKLVLTKDVRDLISRIRAKSPEDPAIRKKREKAKRARRAKKAKQRKKNGKAGGRCQRKTGKAA